MLRTPKSPAIIELQNKYSNNPEKLLAAFNADLQAQYCRDVRRVFMGTAPTLSLVRLAFGNNIATLWLCLQLENLAAYAGCKGKLNRRQYEELSQMIVNTYPYFNLTEVMLFFQQFKSGEYGTFYGAVDPIRIMEALAEFNRQRTSAHIHYEHIEEQEAARQRKIEYEAIRNRYSLRVPGAWTDKAVLDFNQYRLMGFNRMSDEEFESELQKIISGERTVPPMPKTLQSLISAFNNDNFRQ